jgi:hypothetical protein
MSRLLVVLLLAGCSPTVEIPTPVAYTSACPLGDEACQRNQDAQTLAYIGQPDAALRLMCLDNNLANKVQDTCEFFFTLY